MDNPPRQRWAFPKDDEKNVVAAFFHLLTISFICTSLIQLDWFQIWGGHCSPHLSTNQFFEQGEFYETTQVQYHLKDGSQILSKPGFVTHYNTSSNSLSCVTPEIASMMHIVILLSVMAIFCSLVGFCLDMIAPSRHCMKVLRRNAVPSITTVFIIITIIGVCYFITRRVELTMDAMKIMPEAQITFDSGCYGVTAAGSFSILATACNLLQSPSQVDIHQGHSRLVEDWDDPETFSVGMRSMPHDPPPYTP